jgi:hypothetical protein
VAWFSKFQVTTTFRSRPIAPLFKIALARCHDGSSGKLKSTIVGCALLRAGEICSEGLLEEDRFSELEGALRDGGLEIGRYRDGHYRNGALLDQCLPTAEPARHIRSASALRRPHGVGSSKRHNFAAGIVAERRDEDGFTVVAPDDANTNHPLSP